MPKQKRTRLDLEALALAELRKAAGCEHAVSVTINRRFGDPSWALTTFNPGRCYVKFCAEALETIVARMQQQYDFAEDPVQPMPRRL